MPAAQKGGSKSGHRTFARRPEHQNPSRRQGTRLPGPLHPYRRPGGDAPRLVPSLMARPPRSSSLIPLTTPTTSAKPSPQKVPRLSFQTTLHGPASIRSTTISTRNVTSSNAASASSSSFAASLAVSRRQPKATSPSSPSRLQSYGCGKCPQDLGRGGEPERSQACPWSALQCWTSRFGTCWLRTSKVASSRERKLNCCNRRLTGPPLIAIG